MELPRGIASDLGIMTGKGLPLTRVALIGVGSIAASYVEGFKSTAGFEIAAVCSQRAESASAFASTHGLTAMPVSDMLANQTIDYVLNLTPAGLHAEISRICLEAGKSVYSEKPLAASLEEADALIDLAEQQSLLLACAPATVLWPPLATARRLITEGSLGAPVGAVATLVYLGPEIFHANPAQFYRAEAGPLKDMGVYQVTALLALFGPVIAVSAMASCAKTERRVMVGLDAGTIFPVGAPTHVNALLRHANGVISTIIVSFDAVSATASSIDIFGQDAGLRIDNPHRPDAAIVLQQGSHRHLIPLDDPPWTAASLAIGPVNAWAAYQAKTISECSARNARDVLSILLAIEKAAYQATVEWLPAHINDRTL